jgi:uncharacterized SAM-binding protein YcdF (DUF218 family)
VKTGVRLRREYKVGISVGVILLGATLFITRERILLAVGNFLMVQDNLEPADVIHVIAGEEYRSDYAIQLYHQGYGKQILFTGGWCLFHNENHGERGKRRALELGIPLASIAIDDTPVTSTYSEVVRLKEFIAQSRVPVHSVIVVSDPHHMRRARWAYRQVLGDERRVQMAPVTFEMSPYKHRWWTDEKSRRMVKDEYMKFGYYLARYQFSWGPLKEWLASLDRD